MQRDPTLALKPRTDVTRSPKQGHQWPHKKDLCPPKLKKKNIIQGYLAYRPTSEHYDFEEIDSMANFNHEILTTRMKWLFAQKGPNIK